MNHSGSLLQQTNTSWGIKLLRKFKTILLKIKIFLSACLFSKALTQSNLLTDCLIRSTFEFDSAKPHGRKWEGKGLQDYIWKK